MNRRRHRAEPTPVGRDPRAPIRRAYLLGQMVATLPLLLVASALLTSGIHATLRSQKRSAELAARDTAINSLLDALRRDTRRAGTARALPADPGAFAFALRTPDGDIEYRFAAGCATRTTGGTAPQTWCIKEATLTTEFDAPQTPSSQGISGDSQSGSPFDLLTVHIRWRGASKRDLDPSRRFDATFSVGRGYRQ